jgi:hypothetical protein
VRPARGRAGRESRFRGQARLFVDGVVSAEQRLNKVNLIDGGESVAFYIGRAGGSTVGEGYEPPFPFTGKLERLTIVLD